jgi:voltage-gated potassium channel
MPNKKGFLGLLLWTATRFRLPWRYVLMIALPILLVIIGTIGYEMIERKYTWFDALYMTVITLTTVGYGEIPEPLSIAGRTFTMFLLLGGVFTLFYTATELVRSIISGEIHDLLGKQRMAHELAEIRDHLIIVGYGRMGRQICRDLSRQGVAFVVIDRDEDHIRDFDTPGGLVLCGDAANDETLRRAGVDRAKALITVLPSDADNLYICMSARLLNDRLFIVSRAEDEQTEPKLRRVGANRVISPYAIGGSLVALAVLRPTVTDFLDLATRAGHPDLQIEELQIRPGSTLHQTTLQASKIRQDLGLIILAIKKGSGQMLYNPPGDAVMDVGDTLIALGHRAQLDQLEQLAGMVKAGK